MIYRKSTGRSIRFPYAIHPPYIEKKGYPYIYRQLAAKRNNRHQKKPITGHGRKWASKLSRPRLQYRMCFQHWTQDKRRRKKAHTKPLASLSTVRPNRRWKKERHLLANCDRHRSIRLHCQLPLIWQAQDFILWSLDTIRPVMVPVDTYSHRS